MSNSNISPNQSLHIAAECAEADMMYEALDREFRQISYNWQKNTDNSPYWFYPVNNDIFNENSLKTDSYVLVHEKDIYQPELAKRILIFFQENAALKTMEMSPTIYSKIKIAFDNVLSIYFKETISTVAFSKKSQSDEEFQKSVQPIMKPERFDYLVQLAAPRETFTPLLELLKTKDSTVLGSAEFFKNLNKFLSSDHSWSEPRFYDNPFVQKLALELHSFPPEELERHFGLKKLKKQPPSKQTIFSKILTTPLSQFFEPSYSSYSVFEAWGNYAIKSSAFQTMPMKEQKNILHFILDQYKAEQINYSGYSKVLLNTCCELYSSRPELLEYRSLCVMIQSLTQAYKNSSEMLDKIKPLLSLTPDIPHLQYSEEVKNMLLPQETEKNYAYQAYEQLMPVFEAIMVKQMLEKNTTNSNGLNKSHKI